MSNSDNHTSSDIDSSNAKLFIGGLSWDTTEEKLKEYFESNYGTVLNTTIMRNRATGKSRGFGFVVFEDEKIAAIVAKQVHTLDGRSIDAKWAVSREKLENGAFKTRKIFVGGIPYTLTEDGFRTYFEQFGVVTEAQVMIDKESGRSRGFGFITFEDEETVEATIARDHQIEGKSVDVKKAEPKKPMNFGGMQSMPMKNNPFFGVPPQMLPAYFYAMQQAGLGAGFGSESSGEPFFSGNNYQSDYRSHNHHHSSNNSSAYDQSPYSSHHSNSYGGGSQSHYTPYQRNNSRQGRQYHPYRS